jgi:hypothetical protein
MVNVQITRFFLYVPVNLALVLKKDFYFIVIVDSEIYKYALHSTEVLIFY